MSVFRHGPLVDGLVDGALVGGPPDGALPPDDERLDVHGPFGLSRWTSSQASPAAQGAPVGGFQRPRWPLGLDRTVRALNILSLYSGKIP